ncbi:gliding motility-associated C-terminal domain-containing protein [Ekhidna sp. To15]|uniref:gliding motility-associated C-terminal domain-containing protein n=1 Tax=Ekhidna sp. To15 TaxID=3395267 RepID=UPI003F52489F
MHRWRHILLLLLLPILADAQVFSSKGRFSVEFDRGCNPMTVNITEYDSFGAVTRQYYYFEGAGITNNKTFTYQDAGIYQIVQIVGVDGIDDRSDTLFVEAFEPLVPDIQIQMCNGREVSITSQDTYYDSIRVYFTVSDSVTLLTSETAQFGYSNTSTQAIGLKGFFDNADEVCTAFFQEINPIPTLLAPNITNAAIKETCKDLFSLYLELDAIDTLTNYRINLTQGSTTRIYDGYIKQNSIVLSDIPFARADYCLNIEAFDPCNGTSTFSQDFCAESSDLSLSPFQSLYSSYGSSGIYINLDSVNRGTFNIYRRLEGEEFDFRSEQTSSFTDPIGSNGRKYYYRLDYVDSCGQILYTAETNPPLVDATKESTNQYLVIFSPPVNSLTDSPQNNYQTGNDFSQTENQIPSTEFSVQLDAKDGSPRQFVTVSSVYPDGTTLRSNSVTVRYQLVIYVPTAFTPNGDGLNDTLELFGLPTETATTNIYTRWGQLVYSSDIASPGWDGTINGSIGSEGTYLYEIIFETADGNKRMQKGTFTLIKK